MFGQIFIQSPRLYIIIILQSIYFLLLVNNENRIHSYNLLERVANKMSTNIVVDCQMIQDNKSKMCLKLMHLVYIEISFFVL